MIGMGIYVKNGPKAIELYKAAFGLELGYHVLNNDGTYYQLMIGYLKIKMLSEEENQ